ncbi:hypothetical protein NDU88_002290 [Pleurodeles waltl]|uniref:Uncharacterized protein n=1 Tax=Pleurodeles waltl TaxID=8319 RepID=A0AAV7RBJ1_PLEWA|nr:hypothetical protein NDU88_002290 [Pleurodeles waltl]
MRNDWEAEEIELGYEGGGEELEKGKIPAWQEKLSTGPMDKVQKGGLLIFLSEGICYRCQRYMMNRCKKQNGEIGEEAKKKEASLLRLQTGEAGEGKKIPKMVEKEVGNNTMDKS